MIGKAAAAALLLTAAGPAPALAHGGGLDAAGCHHDRKTGDDHCHRAAPGSGKAGAGGRPKESPAGPFPNCAAARAAGAAPVRLGAPGYAPRLDRDGDGVGCE